MILILETSNQFYMLMLKHSAIVGVVKEARRSGAHVVQLRIQETESAEVGVFELAFRPERKSEAAQLFHSIAHYIGFPNDYTSNLQIVIEEDFLYLPDLEDDEEGVEISLSDFLVKGQKNASH